MVALDRKLFRDVGALALIVGPLQFVIAMAVEEALRPGFSPISDTISALGVGPHAILFNVSVALVGIFTLLGLGAVLTAFPRGSSFGPATVLVAIAGVGAICVGLFPENTGAPHGIAAAMAFIGAGLAMILYFFPFRKEREWTPYALPSLAGGFVDLAALILFEVDPIHGLDGLFERMIVAPVLIWAPLVGLHVYRTRTTDP